MKAIYKPLKFFLLSALSILLINCDYDVAQPIWYDDYQSPTVPVISAMTPADSAIGGDNYIKILGHNFASATSDNLVYFDNVNVDVVESGVDFLTVRRPNLSAEGIIINVVSYEADQVARFEKPYKVTSVVAPYGGFIENQVLSALAVDAGGNVFVVDSTTKNILSSDADGNRVKRGTANRPVYKMTFGNDGNLYLFCNNRAIDFLDVNTNIVDRWSRMPSGKMVQCGDFSRHGYLYTGGRRTGLLIVKVEDQSITDTEKFSADEIKNIRVTPDYVYVHAVLSAPGEDEPEEGLWRFPIYADGSLGEAILAVDLSAETSKTGQGVSNIFINAEESIFISTDSEQPMLIKEQGQDQTDYFYKDILPFYCKDMYWGTDNYAYVISGDSKLGIEWSVYRIDMGSGLK